MTVTTNSLRAQLYEETSLSRLSRYHLSEQQIAGLFATETCHPPGFRRRKMTRSALFPVFAVVVIGMRIATAASQATSPAGSMATQSNSQIPVSAVPIPFELVNRHIVLKVKVNNSRPLSFVLDTGDKFAIVNLDRAKEFGLKLQGEVRMGGAGAAEVPSGAFVRDASFTIPGLPGFSQPITLALPIGRLASRFGQDFDGIIGSEFIKEFVVEIDYSAQLIKLHDKNAFIYSGPGESVPVQLNLAGHGAGHPIMEAEVTPVGGEPIKGKFVLDIGSGGALSLHSPFVTEHNLPGPNMKTIKAFGAGAGGEVNGQIGRVSELKIGKFKINNPTAMFSQDKAGAFADPDLAGNIGAQITSRFRLFLDYSHDRIIFESNARFGEPFDRASSGLSLQAEGSDYHTFLVKDVLDNSPASEAGLHKGDIITSIDGRPTAGLTLTKVNEMFERPVSYKLTVKRGERTLNVTLTPRKLV
jgi:PDZ domain/Aspartyl protease